LATKIGNFIYTIMKVGDKVICINNSISRNGILNKEPILKKYAIYIVRFFDETPEGYPDNVELEDYDGKFPSNKFLTLKEYRKQKLLKIKKSLIQ